MGHPQSALEVWLHRSYADTKDVSFLNRHILRFLPQAEWSSNSVNEVVAQFVTLYTRGSPKWANMSNLATSFGWSDIVAQSTAEYLDSQGISPKFTREMVEAATRVNYGQDSDKIHALEGACSMATCPLFWIAIFCAGL